ncbi:MAG: type III-A CRISPR-associated RAMP protein Csm3 [Desulfobacterales bacterium]|nr:type III-A CRISPR-associated RAMP protein Csm3 [Desulfobacterales bacterium]
MTEPTKPDNFRLGKKVFIEGTITAVTGLHIGGSSIGMAIGGADAVVIRNPLTDEPYIPGSSLRGKMRSLMEKARGEMQVTIKEKVKGENDEWKEKRSDDYEDLASIPDNSLLPQHGGEVNIISGPSKKADSDIGKLFGVAADNESATPTRFIVRDARLTRLSKAELEGAKNTDMPMTEVKTEVWIDRITSAATPRQIERIPAGAIFSLELILNLYGGDDRDTFLSHVWEGLELVQSDYLGGNGGRGYGQVKFAINAVKEKDMAAYQNGTEAAAIDDLSIPSALGAEK